MPIRPYKNEMKINSQNEKMKGGNVKSADTIKGCTNGCESCWAKKGSARTVDFSKIVKITNYIGKVQDDTWYRFGNVGDPGTDWKHTEKYIKKLNPKNFFVVTKLLTLKGFTGYIKNIQVSVDPLIERHFNITLGNVAKILRDFPDVKIVLRVRSCSTLNLKILSLQDTVVKFANMHGLPIMETRMRFTHQDAFSKYHLNKEDYTWEGGYHRPHHGKRFIVGAKKYYDCDLYGMKCATCPNCISPWSDKQFHKNGDFIAPRHHKDYYKRSA